MKDNLYIKASVKDGQLHFPIKAIGIICSTKKQSR